ncbi:hypothetical protein CTRI78_v012058 [Colletotrichum trifolii]|uniref:Chromosome segregation ATPase family protein n=1 Tax=Colletotrichum trifolii TaxID=5466 RepID=A0A4R8PZ17_COLTR|nr:hypothetical protein CTRI78_v012058 [Colletotrichum trifolii]
MNPQSPSVSTSRKGTSSAIQSAHAALTERARESAMVPAPLAKRNTEISPERSLIRGSHKRMQSLQPGSVRDLSLLLESSQPSNPSSPSKSPERHPRPSTPAAKRRDSFSDVKSAEKEASTPSSLPSLTPTVRPTIKRQQQSILGENIPPQSATMLALQNMPLQELKEQDSALINTSDDSTALVKAPQSVDALSGQLLSLTSIATALQKDMAQLSRRSRDNATDLLSLKEATKARDEDIRKSLRELIHSSHDSASRPSSRDPFASSLLLDTKSHHTSPPASKTPRPFSLPRIPSPNSFAASIDRDSLSTPSLCNSESPATLAILDKIIRDMGTKEGHDLLLARLADVAEKLAGVAPASKVDELIQLVRTKLGDCVVSQAQSRGGGGRPYTAGSDDESNSADFDFDPGYASQLTQRSDRMTHHEPPSRTTKNSNGAVDLVNDEVLRIIRTVKDSVAQGGGLTAEVKALVRELRGEVLGMGREIGRRMDEINTSTSADKPPAASNEVSRVVQEGLDRMTEHLDDILQEHRRQFADFIATRELTVDYQEIYNAMRAALRDSRASQPEESELSREDVMEAVKAAWENYKPELEAQDVGLGRDQILDYLKEGLQDYVKRDQHPTGASREEVFQAVVEGLKHFSPPRVDTPASLSRDEILEAVRECLEEFEFPVAPSAFDSDLTRDDVVQAVREGLNEYELPTAGSLVPHHVNNEEITSRLQEILEYMRSEFRTTSEVVEEHAAANATAAKRNTEQLLDVTRDGLDRLRTDLHGHIDHLATVNIHEELTQTLLGTLDAFRDEMACLVDRVSSNSTSAIENHMESLRDTVNSSMVPVVPQVNQKEIIEAVREGVDGIRSELRRPFAGVTEILDALHDGLVDVRTSIDKVSSRPTDLTANDEILDALKTGLGNVRADIDGLRDQQSQSDRALTTMNDAAVVPADVLKQDDIRNLEVLISQLRIKIEAMEPSSVDPVTKDDMARVEAMLQSLQESASKDDVLRLEDMLRLVQESVSKDDTSRIEAALVTAQASVSKDDVARLEETLNCLEDYIKSKDDQSITAASHDGATKEDVQAIETILRNTKGRLDDIIDGEQAVRKEHLDSLELIVLEAREAINLMTTQMDGLSRKDDLLAFESLITQMVAALEDIKESTAKQLEDPDRVTKTDVDAIETACLDIKGAFDRMIKADLTTLATKEDLQKTGAALEELKAPLEELKIPMEGLKVPLEDMRARLDALADSHAIGSDERQAEIVGVGERVSEVKSFLEDFQKLVKNRLEDGVTGVETLAKLLESVSAAVEQNAAIGQELKDLSDTMKMEFEESKAGVVGAKLDADEKFLQTTDIIGTRVDEKVGQLMVKYDELQAAIEERAKAGDARDADTEAAVLSTKVVAEDLKSLVDTLGSAVADSMEKMEEASKTVFIKVEDLMSRSEDNHTDGKAEHQQTRDQLKQAVEAVEGLQGQFGQFQPQVLETMKNILMLVGQHYDFVQLSTTEIQRRIEDANSSEKALLPPPERYDDSVVIEKLDQLVGYATAPVEKFNDTPIQEKLDKLFEHVLVPAKEYDDAAVQAKLDKLVEKSEVPVDKYDDSVVMEKLDKVIEHVTLPVEKYDDGPVQEKLSKLVEHALVPPEKYDDALVLDKLDTMMEYVSLPHDKYDDTSAQEKLDRIIKQILIPAEKYDDAGVQKKLDKLVEHSLVPLEKYDDGAVLEKLDILVEHALLPVEKYDDAAVRDKLDELVDHSHAAEKAFAQLDTLEKVHRQVIQTAGDISLFLASQTKRIEEEEDDREKTLRQTVVALECKLALKEQIEVSLEDLRLEEERLKASVAGMRQEQDGLTRQKIRLTADVSSLETALNLRREELHEMEIRAEGLERRILEGVMDHSRVLLMSKATKGRDAMSRKRVPGQRSNQESEAPGNITQPAVNLALSAKRNSKHATQTGPARRILSLSQITNNMPTGGVQRSQSVRIPGGARGLRKSSWGGGIVKGYGDLDKENMSLKETDEENMPCPASQPDPIATTDNLVSGGDGSDTETLRRSSRGTTVVTDSTDQYIGDAEYSNVCDDVQSDWTESIVGSTHSQEMSSDEVVVFGQD